MNDLLSRNSQLIKAETEASWSINTNQFDNLESFKTVVPSLAQVHTEALTAGFSHIYHPGGLYNIFLSQAHTSWGSSWEWETQGSCTFQG